ncbi:histidine kinase dimerization/phospho-acceptor domain-containing protein [Acetobacterium bakii]|uniref:histidine kinase dimerization/phospho-acceptor domain-containing protein n=1 Tax=Acetobacterium bakii TaxID=52689 RepID=UPI000680E707|nr:histidine kinase dimerization/phospho-acceptor domain-containing protein [Acetobacterium bakii]
MTRGNYEISTNIRQNDEIGQLSKSLDMLSAKLNFSINKIFEEKEKLDDIISRIPEGIIAYDIDLSLINYNQSLLSLYGYSSKTDIENQLKLDLEKQGLLAMLLNTMATNKKQTIINAWRYQILKYTFTPVKNNCSATTGVVILIQDISEGEKLEKMRKDFIANVSHELRTPLTLIQGSVEAIIDETVTSAEETKKYHKRILHETLRLERIVSDLLDLSRIDVGKMSFTLVPSDF